MSNTLSLRISILGLQHTSAAQVLSDFLALVRKSYPVNAQSELYTDCAHSQAELTIAVPFSERERIRIDFNIFSADFETRHPNEPAAYFKLESA